MAKTLPVVPVRIIKHILNGNFVDIAELFPATVLLEFECPVKGDNLKSTSRNKWYPIPDRDEWVCSFAQYAGVVSRTYPEKAVSIWGHLASIMSDMDQRATAWCKYYNIWLHHGYFSIDEANTELDQCLYTQALVESTKNRKKISFFPSSSAIWFALT